MNLRGVIPHIVADAVAGNAVILKSQPGVGKTDLTYGLYAKMQAMYPGKSVGFCRTFMATNEPTDAIGLQWKAEKDFGDGVTRTVTDPAVPSWALDIFTGKPCWMFDICLMVFEEWGQCPPETKKAFAPVLFEGGVPSCRLPAGSWRVALSNTDQRDGVTKELDFIIGRRTDYTIQGDVDVWVEDYASKPYQYAGRTWQTDAAFIVWAKQHPEIMFEDKPKVQGQWCNPRTLCAADRYTQAYCGFDMRTLDLTDAGWMEGMQGHIGAAAATSMIGTLQFRIELPSLEDVVADPAGTKIPGRADLQMLMAYELAGRVKVDQVPQVLAYMSRKEMPKDMSVTFVTGILRRDYKNFIHTPAMQAWINKNAQLVSIISSLAA